MKSEQPVAAWIDGLVCDVARDVGTDRADDWTAVLVGRHAASR